MAEEASANVGLVAVVGLVDTEVDDAAAEEGGAEDKEEVGEDGAQQRAVHQLDGDAPSTAANTPPTPQPPPSPPPSLLLVVTPDVVPSPALTARCGCPRTASTRLAMALLAAASPIAATLLLSGLTPAASSPTAGRLP